MADKRKKLSRFSKAVLDIIMIAALITAGFSGYKLWEGIRKYQTAKKNYDDIRDTVIVGYTETETGETRKKIDWQALRETNPDIAAWIELEGSSIDYPVVHGTDNSWYLRHLMDGTYNDAGTVFIDAGNSPDFTDRNTVMYAHHMLNEPLMFAEVENYKDQAYYDTHKKFLIHTPDAEYEMYPAAGYVTTGSAGYVSLSFADDEEFLAYVRSFEQRSTFVSDVTVTAEDQTLMLSTCSYDVKDGRYVLIGRLVKISGQ